MSVRTGFETAALSLLAIGPLLSAGCFSPPGQDDSETEATAGEETNAAESAPTDGGPGATGDAGTTEGGGGTTDVVPDTGNVDEDSTGSADDDGSTGSADDDGSTGSDEEGSTGTPEPACGDGNADPGEFCLGDAVTVPVPFYPIHLVAGDMNDTGNLDLVYSDESQMQVALGNGAGSFAAGSSGANSTRGLALGHFDNDADLDIAYLDGAAELHVILNDGNGTIQTGTTAHTISGGSALAAGDLDGNGYDDAMTVGNGSSITAALSANNGSGALSINTVGGIGGTGIRNGVLITELNGNSNADFAFTDILDGGQVIACLGNGSGGVASCGAYPVGNLPFGLAAGDIDGDGNVDLVTADIGSNSVTWLRGQGNGGFDPGVAFDTITGAEQVAIADLNNDGYEDVAIALLTASALHVRLYDPELDTLGAPHIFAVGQGQLTEIATGDFNGDGATDVAVGNDADSIISVFLSDA